VTSSKPCRQSILHRFTHLTPFDYCFFGSRVYPNTLPLRHHLCAVSDSRLLLLFKQVPYSKYRVRQHDTPFPWSVSVPDVRSYVDHLKLCILVTLGPRYGEVKALDEVREGKDGV
jgi:hypothetical protein